MKTATLAKSDPFRTALRQVVRDLKSGKRCFNGSLPVVLGRCGCIMAHVDDIRGTRFSALNGTTALGEHSSFACYIFTWTAIHSSAKMKAIAKCEAYLAGKPYTT